MQVYHVVKNMVEQSVWNKVFLLNLVRVAFIKKKTKKFHFFNSAAFAPNVACHKCLARGLNP